MSFPSNEAHSGHPIGQEAVHTQKVHPQVAQKIMQMISSGITETTEVKRSLKYYVDNFLCKEIGHKPHPHDRAFYPLKQDIANHINMAKKAIDLSTFDQENLRMKVEEWEKATRNLYFISDHIKRMQLKMKVVKNKPFSMFIKKNGKRSC